MSTTQYTPGTLPAQGYRFVLRNGVFAWSNDPAHLVDGLDCTDMSDEEFEHVVSEATAA
jgi:hypothetical protein